MLGIVFNPVSYSGRSTARMKHVRDILDERGVEYVYRETVRPGDGTIMGAELAETCDTVVAGGGDGTVFEVLNGIFGKGVTLMVLPFGSGNDAATSIGVNGMTDEELVDVLMEGKTRKMDCIRTNGEELSIVHSCVGIVSNIIRDFKDPANARKSYMSTMLTSIRQSRPRRYHIRTSETDREFFADFVSAQNIITSGGGMVVCPEAVDDDMKFDLVVIEHRTVLRKYLNLIAMVRKKLTKQRNVFTERTDSVEIEALDGEETCSLDGELREIASLNVDLAGQIDVIHP